MTKLILGGGGGAENEKPLDELLLSLMPKGKMLYIPLHWKSGDFEGCLEWIKSVFAPLGFKDIEMWTKLEGKTYESLKSFGAIFIGGGNTYVLMNELRRTNFTHVLNQFVKSDRPVFGGSAGAIIWGKDIRTASFGEDSDENTVGLADFTGLNRVNGYTIQCHYKSNQDKELAQFVKENKLPVIALPEGTGLYVQNDRVLVKGFQPAAVFSPKKKLYKVGSEII